MTASPLIHFVIDGVGSKSTYTHVIGSKSFLRVILALRDSRVNMERLEILVTKDRRVPMVLQERKDQQDLMEVLDHEEQKETKALRFGKTHPHVTPLIVTQSTDCLPML